MKRINFLLGVYRNFFNIKFAVLSAIVNGGITFMINLPHGWWVIVTAASAQASSSFLSTGMTARIVQHFSPVPGVLRSYGGGSVVPTTITWGMSIVAHLLNGTPDPFLSAMPATCISFVTSFVTNWITRRGYLRPANYPTDLP